MGLEGSGGLRVVCFYQLGSCSPVTSALLLKRPKSTPRATLHYVGTELWVSFFCSEGMAILLENDATACEPQCGQRIAVLPCALMHASSCAVPQ